MKTSIVIGLLVLFKTLYLLTPLAILWGLNTLFSAGLGYTFTNWLAVFAIVFGLRLLLSTRVEVERS